MDRNPYTPPTAPVSDRSQPSSAVRAILVGLAIDIGGTLVLGTVVGIVYGVVLMSKGASLAELEAAVSPTSPMGIVMSALGCGLSALGGYVCSRMAQRTDYRLGVVLAAISSIIGLLLAAEYSPLYLATMLALTFASVLLGTHFAVAAQKRKAVSG